MRGEMMKRFFLAAAFVVSPVVALAQAPVNPPGGGIAVTGTTPTAGHCAQWSGPFSLADAGYACGGGGGASLPAASTSQLFGGTGSANTAAVVTLGTNLSLSGGVLNATGGGGASLPSASTSQLYGGTGSANNAAAVTLGSNLSLSGGVLNATGGGTPGGTSGQIQTNNAGAFSGVTPSGDVASFNPTTGAFVIGSIGGDSVSLGGPFSTTGAYALTLALTGPTTLTLPTSGTAAQNTLANASNPYACQNTGISGFCYNIKSFGGHADARRGAAAVSASATLVGVDSVQIMDNVTISSTGGATFTITPAFLAPVAASMAANSIRVYINCTCGTGNVAVNGFVSSANATTGVVTLASANVAFLSFSNTSVGISTVDLGQASYSALNGLDYGAAAITTLTDSTGYAYGSQIVLPDAMMPYSPLGSVQAGNNVCIKAASVAEWCGIITSDGNTDGETFSATGANGFTPSVPTALASASQVAVYWGNFLFWDTDATACSGTGRRIEVPLAGTGVNTYGGQQNAFEGTISAITTPFSATLTSSVATAVVGTNGLGGVPAKVTVGCDDYAAYTAAVTRIMQQQGGKETPYRIYFPGDSFMATAVVANAAAGSTPVTQAIQCGEGTVFWPYDTIDFRHGATSCGNTRKIQSFPSAHDLIPASTLVHLQQVNAACLAGTGRCTATITVAGNSPLEPGSNAAGFISARFTKLVDIFQRDYPALTWTLADRTIGGQQMPQLDPNGYTNGYPSLDVGSVNTGNSTLNWWYTDPTQNWMSYVEATNPDVLIFGFADQEAISEHFSAILDLMSYTQNAAWKSATGWNPDIGFFPFPYQPTGFFAQAGTNFAAAMQRSFVKACTMTTSGHTGNTMMAAQTGGVAGCPFLLDLNRMQSVVTDGYDPEQQPMRRTLDLPAYRGLSTTTFPWTIPTPMPGRTVVVQPYYPSASASAGTLFSTAGYELDFTIGALGNGTPQNLHISGHATVANSNSNVLTVGYLAYQLKVGDLVNYPSIPTGTYIQSISTTGCTSTSCAATITLSNPVTIGTGNTLGIYPPGPTLGYPGNILRVYKDQSGVAGGGTTGNVAYRYDTVYTLTPGSDCSGTSGQGYITCASPEVGGWHQGLQIAIPGGGSAQCPNPGGAANCYIATIGTVTYANANSQQINFASGTLTNTVSAVQPIIYRTSIPYTVTTRAAETLNENGGGECSLSSGVYVYLAFQVEYRGSRAILSYCDFTGPGPSMLLNKYVERLDAPFVFSFDSPNHLGSGAAYLNWQQNTSPSLACNPNHVGACGTGSFGPNFEADPTYPTAEATARVSPDVYGYCNTGGGTFGSAGSSPYGGQCAAHQGQMGATVLDDALYANLRAN